MRFFELSGLAKKGDVNMTTQYMGGVGITDLTLPVFYEYQDTASDANRNVRGGVKQTYEPTPLGFETGANAAPIWGLDPAALDKLKGEAWATGCGSTNIQDRCPGDDIALGRVKLGAGEIQFIGALLPDPTEEFYHPYGLDPYATTYSGNQMFRNMLYWGNVLASPPVVIDASGEILQSNNEPQTAIEAGASEPDGKSKDSPGIEPVVLLAALAALAIVRRRR
jgi:MYXO-CTERM domain-containing protein